VKVMGFSALPADTSEPLLPTRKLVSVPLNFTRVPGWMVKGPST